MSKIICLVFIALSLNTFGQKNISVESIWKTYEFFPKGIEGFRGMKDGEHFSKISEIDGNRVITKHAITDYKGAGESILDLSGLKIDGNVLNVDDYEFNSDETQLVLTCETEKVYRRSYRAVHYIYNLVTKKLEVLDNTHSPQTLARFSPDGKNVAYIYDNNIYVKNLSSSTVTQVTNDGKFNSIINGTTDWVYEEEFAITEAYGWSSDSKAIAFLKFNESAVKDFTMTYYNELYPDLYTFKYPKAGEDNSKVTAHIYSIESKNTVAVSLGEYEYIPRISWSNKNNTLVLQTLNRHQNHVKYHKISWDGKSANSSVFFEELSKTYVEIDDNLIFLNDGKSILRTSEKNGFNHIYLIGFDGSERQITKGNWDVRSFKGIDNENKFIYYVAPKASAIHQGVYKISLDGKKDVALTIETGHNDAEFTVGMKYFVHEYANANTPPVFKLCTNTGKVLATMEENSRLKEKIAACEFAKKEFLQFELAGRTLNGWMIKPTNFDPAKKYPVYINIYGGPGSNMVYDGWDFNLPYHQLLAQEGYIVVSVDPRGTMYRGADFKKMTYLELGKLETEDFIDVAKKLQEMSFVDPTRIGIQGWSYGGFMTSLAMTKGNGIFKMGIAVAPVTNWRYYDNIYTERFMRTPAENADGYDKNSPINFVKDLKGKYFLIHGSGDDNVHYQNTMEMIEALVNANKQFDLFIYPNKDHGIFGGNTRNHLFNMLLNYTKNNL